MARTNTGGGGGGGTVTNIATSAPITGGPIATSGTIGITEANTSTDGYLSSSDWNIFNSKLSNDLTFKHFLVGDNTNHAVDIGPGLLYDPVGGQLMVDSSGLSALPFIVTSSANTAFGATSSNGQVTFNMVPSGSNVVYLTYLNKLMIGTAPGVGDSVSNYYSFDDAGNFFAGDTTAGVSGTVSLVHGSSGNYVQLNAYNGIGTTWSMYLPGDAGTNGYILSTDGSGNTSWIPNGGGGGGSLTATQIAYGDPSNAITSNAGFFYDPTGRVFYASFSTGNGTNFGVFDDNGSGAPTIQSQVLGQVLTEDTSGNQFANVDTQNQILKFGDVSNQFLGTLATIDVANQQFTFTTDGILQILGTDGNPWLQVRPVQGNVVIGDSGNDKNGLFGEYDSANNNYQLYSTYHSVPSSLLESIDVMNGIWSWGDLQTAFNGTTMVMNDAMGTFAFTGNGSLSVGPVGGGSGSNLLNVDISGQVGYFGDQNLASVLIMNTLGSNALMYIGSNVVMDMNNSVPGVFSFGPYNTPTVGMGLAVDTNLGNVNLKIGTTNSGVQFLDPTGLAFAAFSPSFSQIGDLTGLINGTVLNIDVGDGLIDNHVSSQFNVYDGMNNAHLTIDIPSHTLFWNYPNITIDSVPYVFPSSNSAGQLTNDGGGNLSWGNGALPHTIFTPTTGSTVNLVNNNYNAINPTGAILALTLNFPSSPANNDVVEVKFDKGITTVSYSGGTIVGGITTAALGDYVKFVYDSGTSTWY